MKTLQKVLCLMLMLCMTLCVSGAFAQDYTATEQGFGGDVTVTLTVEDGVIVAAKAEGTSETDASAPRLSKRCPPLWWSATA